MPSPIPPKLAVMPPTLLVACSSVMAKSAPSARRVKVQAMGATPQAGVGDAFIATRWRAAVGPAQAAAAKQAGAAEEQFAQGRQFQQLYPALYLAIRVI